MPDREKLIELLGDVQRCGEDYTDYEIYGMRIPDTVSNEEVADHLIANGVTVRERGRWITDQVEAFSPLTEEPFLLDVLQCSVCGEYFDVSEARNFCPNCGADMRPMEEANV